MSRIAFLFPGQGAQSVGMGREVAESLPAARALFDQASRVLGYDLADVCFNGPAEKLDATEFSQPALFVCGLAAVEKLRAERPELVAACAAAAGLSLGEYSALVFAGAMDFEPGLRVVQERGRAMQAAADAAPSAMLSVLGLERAAVEKLCDDNRRAGEVLQVANLLCPGNIVVSGSLAAIEKLGPAAEAAGAMRTIRLAVAGAFHTSLMQPAVERLRAVLAGVNLQRPRVPVWSNVDARHHDDPGEIRELLIRQVCSPVLWEESMVSMLGDGCDEFFEVGPGRVLRGLMKRISRKIVCHGTLEA